MLPEDVQLISVDDHVIEHERVWLDRMAAKYNDRAPRVVELDGGMQAWKIEERIVPTIGLNAVAGKDPKQFGVDAEMVPDLLREIGRRRLAFEGFHIYSGSQNLKAESICEAQSKTLELARKLAHAAPGPVQVLNIGGGFGIPYFPGEEPLDLAPIGANLRELVTQCQADWPTVRLVIELGRYLVGPAGVYHTGRTAVAGPGGFYAGGRTGASGYGGGVYRSGYGYGTGYRGAYGGAYGGYRYTPSYYGGAYGGAYHYGYIR